MWKIRGGHRLWSAPEDFGKEDSLCYSLDNSEVEHSIEDEFTVRVSNLIEKPTKIRREMVVRLEPKSPRITVEHRITNQGDIPLELAPWALSVMAPGGYAILPQPPQGKHPQDYLPNRSIIAWPFTDLSDERFRVGTGNDLFVSNAASAVQNRIASFRRMGRVCARRSFVYEEHTHFRGRTLP